MASANLNGSFRTPNDRAGTYVSQEDAMDDPFVGIWTLNPAQSAFDANHKPAAATMTWKLDADGTYLMLAEGVDAKGERHREKPQRLCPDGVAYPIECLPGLTSV